LLIVTAVLLPLILGLGIWLALFTDTCAIKEVAINGNSHLSSEQVRELSGVDAYKNLLTLPVARLSGNLEREPWIKAARIGRRLPGTVLIGIVERKPLAVVDCCGVGFLTDDSGYVISGVSGEEFASLPRINASDFAPPEVGDTVLDDSTMSGVKVLVAMDGAVRSTIEKVDPAGEGGIIFTSMDGFQILYGKSELLEEKSDVLKAVLEDVKRNDRIIEYVDVRVPDSPVIMPR
jgi:cell division protein FtsQ